MSFDFKSCHAQTFTVPTNPSLPGLKFGFGTVMPPAEGFNNDEDAVRALAQQCLCCGSAWFVPQSTTEAEAARQHIPFEMLANLVMAGATNLDSTK